MSSTVLLHRHAGPSHIERLMRRLHLHIDDGRRPPELPPKRAGQGVGVDDFDLIQFLGAGGFGMVLLGQHRATGEYKAIKVMDKRLVLSQNQLTSVFRERQVLASKEHPFIVSMRHAFQTADHLCFVLDYADGGNMYVDLKRGAYCEHRTQFYASQIVLAIEHLHSQDILYRDLKPDNVLLLPNGNIQLADMGAARGVHCDGSIGSPGDRTDGPSLKTARQSHSRRMTITGTHGYRSPEVYARLYGKPADWWCVGILIIEMLSGDNPLRGENRQHSEQLALSAMPCFPSGFFQPAKETSLAFLVKDWRYRLGTPAEGESEADALRRLKAHAFFADVDFEAMLKRQVPPPFEVDVRTVRNERLQRAKSLDEWCHMVDYLKDSLALRTTMPLSAEQDALFADFDYATGTGAPRTVEAFFVDKQDSWPLRSGEKRKSTHA